MLQEIKSLLEWSIATADAVGIKTAIRQLCTYIDVLKYPLLKSDYEYFIELFYNRLLEYLGDTIIESQIMNILTTLLIRGSKIISIVIDWKPLYKIFKQSVGFDIESSIMSETEWGHYRKDIGVLIVYSRQFFSVDALEEIMEEVKPFLVPHSNYLYFGLYVLSYFLPTHHLVELRGEIPSWIYEFMGIWDWVENNKDWDERWVYLFSRLTKHACNVDWSPLVPRLYTNSIRILDLSIGIQTMSHLKPHRQTIPDSFRISREEKFEYTCIGKILLNLISSNPSSLEQFKDLFSKILSYYHPSNQGDWSLNLIELLISICYSFCKRHINRPFSQNIMEEFIEIVFPPLINALYSKRKNNILNTCKIIKELAYIAPNLIFPRVIDKLFNSIDKEQVNRLISGIELISTSFHPMVSEYPEGKSYVYNCLEIVTQSLDPIYPNKASAAFKFLNRVFTCILLNDETVYDNEDNFKDDIERSTTLATSSFLDWSLLFLESVLDFILNASTKKETETSKRETPPGIFLNETIELFFSQVSDEIYGVLIERLELFFTKTFEPDYYKQFGVFLKSSTHRNPSKSLSTFLPIFIGKICKCKNGEYEIRDLSDEEFKWYLSLMGYVVFRGGSELVKYKDMLLKVFSVLLNSENKSIIKSSSKVLRKIIYSLTRYYPSNTRSIPTDLFERKENHIKYWGETSDLIYPIEWYQPKPDDIKFATEIIDKFLVGKIKEFDSHIQSIKESPNSFDRMKVLKYIKIINNLMRATVYLIEDSSPLNPKQLKVSKHKYQYKQPSFAFGQVKLNQFSKLKEQTFQSFHSLFEFMQKEKNEEVLVLKAISKSYSILFFGKKDIQNKTNETLLEKWKNLKRFHTRNEIIYKSHKMQLIRQRVSYENLPLTQLCTDALEDLVKLSVHRYREVRKMAQSSVSKIIPHFTLASKEIIPLIMSYFTQQRSDEEIKGSQHLLLIKPIFKKIKTNWNHLRVLTPIFLVPLDQKFKSTTRESFNEFKKSVFLSKYNPTTHVVYSKELVNIDKYHGPVPLDTLKHWKTFIDDKNQENYKDNVFILETVIQLLKSHDKKDSFNWKEHVHLISSLFYFLSLLCVSTCPRSANGKPNFSILLDNAETIKEGIVAVVRNMINDYPFTRMLSTNIISLLLGKENTKNKELCHEGFWKGKLTFKDENKMDIDSSTMNGVNGQPQDLSTDGLNMKLGLLNSTISVVLKPLITQLFDDAFFDKFLKLVSQDHDSEGITQNFSVSLSEKCLNTQWPNTRYSVIVKNFKISIAKLINGLCHILGISFFDSIKPRIEALRSKTEKEDQFLLAELVAGLGRYIATNIDEDIKDPKQQEMVQYLSEVLLQSLNLSLNECVDAWSTCLRFICHNMNISALKWLIDTLFKLYNSPSFISSLSKSIHFLRGVVMETTWRSPQFLEQCLEISKKEFHNPYKQVRIEAAKLLTLVLINQSEYQTENGRIVPLPPKLPQKTIDDINSLVNSVLESSASSSSSVSSPTTTSLQGPSTPPSTPTLDPKLPIKESLMSFIQSAFARGVSSVILRSVPTLLPAVLSLASDSSHEIIDGAQTTTMVLSQIFCMNTDLINTILMNIDTSVQSTSWKVRRLTLPFLQIFYFNHSLYFSPQHKETIYNIIFNLMKDPQIEVRELTKNTLASILISSQSDSNRINNLIKTAIKQLNSEKTTNQNITQKHTSILLLSAIILASPYQIPSYFPEVLDQLSRYSDSNPTLKNTVRFTISEFWRTHKDTWEEDKLSFTDDQVETMRSTIVSPSYYA
eukprot:gene5876-7313_t